MNNDTYVAFGDALKTTRKGNQGIVEAVGVRFTGPDDRDLDGEYFTADTDYGPHAGNGMAATLNHRMPMVTSNTKSDELPILQEYAKRIFPNPVKAEVTPQGIIARHILDLADDYEAMIFEMARKGKLRWSSGAPGHMVDKDENKRITTWHIAEWAYTPIAADPNLPTISPIKSLENIELSTAPNTETDDISESTDADGEAGEPEAGSTPAATAPEASEDSHQEDGIQPETADPDAPDEIDELDEFYQLMGDFVETISERIGRLLS